MYKMKGSFRLKLAIQKGINLGILWYNRHMKNQTIKIIAICAVLAMGVAIYFQANKGEAPANTNATSTPATTTSTGVVSPSVYKNSKYGFSIALPQSWVGYSIVEDKWEGYRLDAAGKSQIISETGPLLSVRHPDWEYKSPRQDIPVMVFTIEQWNNMQKDVFHIGAAPINPTELGRNSKYVFGLPARYNFSGLTGNEEVDQIIHGDNFKTF